MPLDSTQAVETTPVTIILYDPGETHEIGSFTFETEDSFDRFMTRSGIMALYRPDPYPRGFVSFDQLEDGAIYATSLRGVPTGCRSLEQYLVQRGERQLAEAVMDDLLEGGAKEVEAVAPQPRERVVKDGVVGSDVAEGEGEADVAVRFVDGDGETRFVIGSLKICVDGDGDSEVVALEKKVARYYEPREPFKGHRVQLAFMAETVKGHGQWDRVKETCRHKGVRLYSRTGRSVSRVQLRAAFGPRVCLI